MNTTTTRDQIVESLKSLPPEATLEDAMEHLYFMAKLEQGLRQSEARDLIAHEKVKQRFVK
jgi:hypothetical protein